MAGYLINRHKNWLKDPITADETLFKRYVSDLKKKKDKKELSEQEMKLVSRLYATGFLTGKDAAALREQGLKLPEGKDLKAMGEAEMNQNNQNNAGTQSNAHPTTHESQEQGTDASSAETGDSSASTGESGQAEVSASDTQTGEAGDHKPNASAKLGESSTDITGASSAATATNTPTQAPHTH